MRLAKLVEAVKHMPSFFLELLKQSLEVLR
jgi:hypothetical protein